MSAKKPDDVSKDVWDSFVLVRKAKRSVLTTIAIDGIKREAVKAGMSLNQALTVCCERGWQSFKADWLVDKNGSGRQSANASAFNSYTTIFPNKDDGNGRVIDATPRLG